jgi:hypothetical protein
MAISLSTTPISVSTMDRSGCPQCSDLSVHDRPTHAPPQLVVGWFGGIVWTAKHWESWAVFASLWALSVGERSCTPREAATLLWQLMLSALLAVGAVRGAWLWQPLAGLVVGGVALLVIFPLARKSAD